MSDTVEWRWVDVDGKQTVLAFDELAKLLSTEALPPFVLVWRTGWPTWLAAANAPELLHAVGTGRSGPPTAFKLEAAHVKPAAPPLERYRGVTQKTLLGLARIKPGPTVPPPPPRPSRARTPEPPRTTLPGGLPSLPPPVSFPPVPIPLRDVQPTLAGEEAIPRSQTLRPAGALPPPPRSFPQQQKLPAFDRSDPIDEADDDDDDDEAETVADADLASVPDTSDLTPETPRGAPRSVPPPMPVSAPPAAVPPASTSPVTAGDVPKAVVSRQTVTKLTMLSLLIPGTALLAAALFWPSKKKPPEAPAAAPTHVVTLPPQKVPIGCALAAPARRLEAAAFGSVPLLTARAPDGKALVGFAASKEQAVGLLVDPTTLEVTRPFEQTVSDSVTLGVVPVVENGVAGFSVDRSERDFSFSRTVDAEKRFAIGVAPEGFARRIGTELTMIWPGKSDNPTITTPRIASTGKGYAVAFRHGGQEGKVLLGFLDDAGAKTTELKAAAPEEKIVGTPSVAVSGGRTLVAFAAKKAPEDPFYAVLALADNGAPPEKAAQFVVPAGGPGGEVISPTVEGLSQGRYLLQWTEGSAGNRAVRIQVLSPTLVPVSDAITLSKDDQNAGQGALWVDGEHALALFLVKNESANELWGAGLRCP